MVEELICEQRKRHLPTISMMQQRCTLWCACCDTQATHCSAACLWGLMDAHSSCRHAASQQYLLRYVEELRCASQSVSVVREEVVLAPSQRMGAACRAVTAAPGTRCALDCSQWAYGDLTAGRCRWRGAVQHRNRMCFASCHGYSELGCGCPSSQSVCVLRLYEGVAKRVKSWFGARVGHAAPVPSSVPSSEAKRHPGLQPVAVDRHLMACL